MTPQGEAPRIGIFGGTFNPIHLGHLRAAEGVAEILGLERVLFVPCASPPHKPEAGARDLAPAAQRLAWTRLAVAGNPRFVAEPLEIERGGTSYSVDTLRALREQLGGKAPVFLIGCDAFREIDTWREPKALLALAHFAVMTRPPWRVTRLDDCLPSALAGELELGPDGGQARHRSAGTGVRIVEITALDISASDVRRRLREGRSVRYLVPEAVHEAILASGTYAPEVG